MSTVNKLKNGKYQTDVRDISGKRLRITFDKKTDATAFNAKIEQEKYTMKLSKTGLGRIPTGFDSVLSEAEKEKKSLAPKTFNKYKNVYKVFSEFLDSERITKVDEFGRLHADKFKEILLSANLAPKTTNFYLQSVKSMFNHIVKKEILDKNPFDHIKMEREKQKSLLEREDDYYNESDIKSFFAEEMENKYRDAFLGLFLTGMRFEELSSLRWNRVDFENKIIQIRSDGTFRTKTASSERDLPMSESLSDLLRRLYVKNRNGYVFTSLSGDKLSERTLLTVCKRIAVSAKLNKNATLHKWRHSFNSHLAQAGVDYTIRQYLLGHKPQSMTDHYTKIDPMKLHGVVSKLDDIVKKTNQ